MEPVVNIKGQKKLVVVKVVKEEDDILIPRIYLKGITEYEVRLDDKVIERDYYAFSGWNLDITSDVETFRSKLESEKQRINEQLQKDLELINYKIRNLRQLLTLREEGYEILVKEEEDP